jgi:murein lipoprotein
MVPSKHHLVMARNLGLAIVVSLGFTACATYDDEFAAVNSRLDQIDTRVQSAAQSAEAANQSAQRANQRLDQLEGRVQQIERAPGRRPRG